MAVRLSTEDRVLHEGLLAGLTSLADGRPVRAGVAGERALTLDRAVRSETAGGVSLVVGVTDPGGATPSGPGAWARTFAAERVRSAMAKRTCDGCDARVSVGGGAETLWTTGESPGGMALTLADGTDHFLCFDCVEALPDDRDATAADVAGLS